ncbi:MAG: guanosine monophosphate reductase [Candidatus Pacearchaeota archaeon]
MGFVSNFREITFDDILLLPNFSSFSQNEEEKEISLKTRISKNLFLDLPIISSPMPAVTNSDMAISLAKAGGFGIIHPFQSLSDQINEIRKVKKLNLKVGIGVSDLSIRGLENIGLLLKEGVDLISLEVPHAHTREVINFIKLVKKKYPTTNLNVSSIITPEAVKDIIKAGADSIRIGIGGGSHCTTRIVTGIGRPQLSALDDCSKVARRYNIPVILDGGIRNSGDITKAIAFGANAVMIGGLFSGTDESPGELVIKNKKKYKYSWGMSTKKAVDSLNNHSPKKYTMSNFRKFLKLFFQNPISSIKKTFRYLFFRDNFDADNSFLEEGIGNYIPYKGSVSNILAQLKGGIFRSFFYLGARNLEEVKKKSKKVLISNRSYLENIPRI